MRLTFFLTVTTGLVLSLGSSVFVFLAALQNKVVDLSSVVTIIGLLVGGSFVGKAAQTFGESIETKYTGTPTTTTSEDTTTTGATPN